MSAAVQSWTSRKASASNANREFAKHTSEMASKGWALQSSNVAQAGRSKRSWVLLGILNFVRGKQVQVTATYVREDER